MAYIISDNIFSPIGQTTAENFGRLLKGESGIRLHQRPNIHAHPFYASLIEDLETQSGFSRFEQMLVSSITDAITRGNVDIKDAGTGIIISSTKGNISLIEKDGASVGQLTLSGSAQKIARYFGNPNKPLVVSNACISGLSALITAKRMIDAKMFETVVVAGADTISAFVFSGFNAFQAISPQPCRPYDVSRNGVTLGEAAATMILSANGDANGIRLLAGAGSNDANHISGPSRTGVELGMAMQKAIMQAGLQTTDIQLISAHGTATVYNDEMEAKAIHYAGMGQVPVNSLKGYYGHTLGAAGIIESIISVHCMLNECILPTAGYQNPGVSMPIRVAETIQHQKINHLIKTASGFGGCNAAVVFSR